MDFCQRDENERRNRNNIHANPKKFGADLNYSANPNYGKENVLRF
jgi:hypothetical protein